MTRFAKIDGIVVNVDEIAAVTPFYSGNSLANGPSGSTIKFIERGEHRREELVRSSVEQVAEILFAVTGVS